jgi:hypothetical protein
MGENNHSPVHSVEHPEKGIQPPMNAKNANESP